MRIIPAADLPCDPESALPFTGERPVLVLDFDGTVCLGDGPVLAYGRAVAAALPSDRAAALTAGLAAYLAGESDPGDFADGYLAVVRLAGPDLDPDARNRAYRASREELADGGIDVHAPDGLAELLTDLGGGVDRVVLTNAPDIGMVALMDRLGLTALLDHVITSAGKPAGFDRLLPALLAGSDPARLLSVGDLWVNDIEAPLAAGCATAYVDRTGVDPRPAHVKATTLPELYPAIRSWAAYPHGFVVSPPPVG